MGVNKKCIQSNKTSGVFITQSKIYNGAFLQNLLMLFRKKNFIIDAQVGSEYFSQ